MEFVHAQAEHGMHGSSLRYVWDVAHAVRALADGIAPLVVIVLVDDGLSLIGCKQRAMQLGKLGVTFGATDFAMLARAYGGHGEAVESVARLRRGLQEGLKRDGFTLLACRIDKHAYDGTF